MAPHQPGRAPRRPQARQASQRGKKVGRRIVRARRPPGPAGGNDVDGASFPPSVDADSRPSAPSVVTPRGAAGTNSPIESEVDGGAIYGALGYASHEEAVAAAATVVCGGNARCEGGVGLVSSGGEDEDSSFVLSDSEGEDESTNRFGLLADEAESSEEESGGEEDTYESEGGGSNSNRFGLLTDEESSSSGREESGSEFDDSSSGGLGSNPFNVLVYGESSSEDDRSELTETVCNISSQHNNDDDSLDDDAAKCAVCFLPDDQGDTWRRLLTLPCCGREGKETSSSTRFCAACILRMATTKSDPSVSNEYPRSDPDRFQPPTGQFYRNDVQTNTRRVIECPRCRDLLVVKIKKPRANESDDESYCDCPDCIRSKEGDWAHPQNAQSISVRIPLFEEKVRYAGKKVGAGGPVAGMLWRAAFLHHGFMPGMCLGPEADCEKLVRWGIVQQAPKTSIPFLQGGKKKKDVFQMGWEEQAKLTEVLDLERAQNEEGYSIFEEDGSPGFEEGAKLLAGAGLAIFRFAMTFRLLGAVRLVNRFLTLILTFKAYVPMFPRSTGRLWVVTALNVFVVTTLLQFLFVTLLYAGCFLGVGLTVCYFLRHGSNPKAIWWQVILAAFFAWRLVTYVYDSPSITWLGWVAPKSVVAIKSLLWA